MSFGVTYFRSRRSRPIFEQQPRSDRSLASEFHFGPGSFRESTFDKATILHFSLVFKIGTAAGQKKLLLAGLTLPISTRYSLEKKALSRSLGKKCPKICGKFAAELTNDVKQRRNGREEHASRFLQKLAERKKERGQNCGTKHA